MSTKDVARNIVNTGYEDLPEEAVEATKKSILDTLGVMLPPSTLVKNCASIYELISYAGGKPESTIIGFGGKFPCWSAAFVNGSLSHAIDFDDTVGLEKPLMHPTGASFPAALATAEQVGQVSGKDFITAVALGNDLSVRLASCPNGNIVTDYPFFSVTTFGVFAAASVSGKILGLTEPEMVNNLGLALNRVSGVTEGLFTSDLREVRDGLNAREGIFCALLASKGMDACKNGIELLFDTYYANDYDIKNLTVDLGKKFRGSEAGFKPWPSCLGTHSYVQGILQIVNEHDIQPEQVEEIILRGNESGNSLCTPPEIKQRPTTSITAKIAIPFVMGVAVVHKNVTIANFLPENLSDPLVLEMAKKIKFIVEPSMGNFSSRVEVRLKDGQVYNAEVDVLRGSILNPLSMEDLTAKFRDCARYSRKPLSEMDIDRLIDRILELEKVKDMAEITGILN
ncbi:MAG: MmgE/PrpD family protein [Deltaproteobacteria bacterium]|nr:MmgE/PrpD family protein [Deltaproteobacteria bacterium]